MFSGYFNDIDGNALLERSFGFCWFFVNLVQCWMIMARRIAYRRYFFVTLYVTGALNHNELRYWYLNNLNC